MTDRVKYKKGDLLRYDDGITALFKVTDISPKHDGKQPRYYGRHCMGGAHGAYQHEVRLATKRDHKTWASCMEWRT